MDTIRANVANRATRGEDHINNAEQVVIDFPEPGNYTIEVKGTAIPGLYNPQQEYYVSYELLPNNIMLAFPFGGEALVPNENITVQWDAWGEEPSLFTLAFSADSGSHWQNISNALPAGKNQFSWQVPAITTTNALLKLTRNSDQSTAVCGRFSIIERPSLSLNANQCPGSIAIDWTPVPQAGYYEAMIARGGAMVVVDTVAATHYIFRNLAQDSNYWVTVRPVIKGIPGTRAVAIVFNPGVGNCAGAAYDNDLMAAVLFSPLSGRKFTASDLGADAAIALQIKNLDDQPVSDYTVSYSINNGNWVSEEAHALIGPMGASIYQFATHYDFSSPGNYKITIAVTNKLHDANTANDTLRYLLRQLDNPPINLSSSFIENFEKAIPVIYSSAVTGIPGIEQFDIATIAGSGNISFPVNTLTDSSGKSLQIAAPSFLTGNASEQSAIATFNLAAYHAANTRIGLGFNLGCTSLCFGCGDASALLIRGNDAKPWIEVMKLNPDEQTFKKQVSSIDISKALTAAGQDFSSSFQIKFTNSSQYNTFLLDDIILYNAEHNLGIEWADTLPEKNCNMQGMVVSIRLNNTSLQDAVNVPVYYKLNNGAGISETAPLVPAGSSVNYNFVKAPLVTAYGSYTVEAGVLYPGDNYAADNQVSRRFRNQPVLNQFPYLEDFEKSDGYWYAEGKNSSWALGRPASPLINRAASGNNAWKTNLSGNHNNSEESYLYSPCINYSSLQYPTLSFSMAINTDTCWAPIAFCESLRCEYSTDGSHWQRVPVNADSSYHWYPLWSAKTYYRWHVVTGILPAVPDNVQFRFIFKSDDNRTFEGVGIDDIHIYDRQLPVYDSTMDGQTLTQNITGGNNWINFTSNQKIIAAIHPYGKAIGNTSIKAYIKNSTPALNFHGQYYLNRSFVLNTATPTLADSIGVRLYFLDKEIDSILYSRNCAACSSPFDAYKMGISQYTTSVAREKNDSISDNLSGQWQFIPPSAIRFVPYDKGYYAEFKVKAGAEFRLNNGGPGGRSWLPLKLLNFSATAAAGGGQLSWASASAINIKNYVIQIAKGNKAFANNDFTVADSVAARGASQQEQTYSYTDASPGKQGVVYYRLKITDEFGNYSFSAPVALLYSDELQWKLYPNPSDGLYQLQYQLGTGEKAVLAVYNSSGAIVMQEQLTGDGFIKQAAIDIKNKGMAKGVYMLRVSAVRKQYYFKLIKQ